MPTSPFGPPSRWPRDEDLIAVSEQFDVDLTLAAYQVGAFPMPVGDGLMGWYSPVRRGVLPLDGLKVSRSLRKTAKRYEIRIDSDFASVLTGCADRRREHGWIDQRIRAVYTRLFGRGVVHTVEAWTADEQLAGGLYGVSVGGLFAGESMFHRADIGRDASKAALIALVDLLCEAGGAGRLLDVQWLTPHLETLGVIEIPRADYLAMLDVALRLSPPSWPD